MESYETIREMPPSAKLVLRILQEVKICDLNRLKSESGLSRRALMYAIKILGQLDFIETKVCLSDTRKRFYCVKLK